MPEYEGLESGSKTSSIGITMRAGAMFIRGLFRKPFMGPSQGRLFIGRGVRLSNARFISHQGRLVIEDYAEVQGVSSSGIRFGKDVSIGARTAIRPSSYYGGPVGIGLVVGDRSSFATGCFIGCSGRIEIGSDVMLGPGVSIFSENHVFTRTDVSIKSQGVERGWVTIGDDCWIGSGVVVASGVEIGRGCVIGAGSVVTRSIPEYSVAAGNPARVMRSRLDAPDAPVS